MSATVPPQRRRSATLVDGTHDAALGPVHTLKGRTGMLGMVELHSIAFSLEQSLKNREPTAFWLEELERTVAEMSQEITVAERPGRRTGSWQ